jgi:hypothetical protein
MDFSHFRQFDVLDMDTKNLTLLRLSGLTLVVTRLRDARRIPILNVDDNTQRDPKWLACELMHYLSNTRAVSF